MNEIICPNRYELINGHCVHYLWPPSTGVITGTVLLGFVNGLATLAGVGGGSISIVIMMAFFQYTPKDSTIVVFCSILGASIGNVSNLVTKAMNGKPLIQYHYAFVSIPLMFTGSLFGVILNKYLPSVAVCSIIVIVFVYTMNKTYNRFIASYQKETQENLLHANRDEPVITETTINPFSDPNNIEIFKNISVLIVCVIILSFVRGSEKFPSLIGVQPCSPAYWFLYLFSFLFTSLYAWRNIKILRARLAPVVKTNEELDSVGVNPLDEHLNEILQKSIAAGIISGFGLGGGIFLVSMYRNMGCTPLQATASCAFTIFLTSFINCIQGISIGVIQLSEFAYFVIFLGVAGYCLSRVISTELRKRNRFSYVQGLLLILTLLAVINIPISLYKKYVASGYDPEIIFGFGTLC